MNENDYLSEVLRVEFEKVLSAAKRKSESLNDDLEKLTTIIASLTGLCEQEKRGKCQCPKTY